MFTHNNPIKILVIGGGEGAVNRELLKHNTVESIYMVDIDNDAINIFKKYLYEWHRNSFSDPRVRLIIDDGRSFLEKSREKFDVIIIDITDPLKSSPSRLLYTFEFYKHVYEKLNDDGLMVTQATSVSYTPENYAIIYNTLKKVFPIVRPFYTYIPSFDSQWGFMMASKKYDPIKISQNELRDRINKRIQGEFKLYDEKYHFKIFILPKDIKKFLEENVKISTDKNPICMPI
ncbi:MAG: spermidine synthase [Thermoprotei archaeon]|nr:MAG: spermidine synthase [Thermoprotei archaeon]